MSKKNGPPRGARPQGQRRPPPPPAKKKSSPLPAIMMAATLTGFIGCLIWMGVYMAEKYVPSTPESIDPDVVQRPKIEATIETKSPKRPVHLLYAPDQVYTPKASDVLGKPIEPVVNGLLDRGVITAFADGLFRADEPVPRAEFVVWCYNALMAQVVKSNDPFATVKKPIPVVEATADPFEDMPADHWAAGVLASLVSAHFYGDKAPKTFRPDEPLRREEWAFYATRFCGSREQVVNMTRQVDDLKLKVALRKLNYTDAQAIKSIYRPYVWFIVGDEKRVLWLQGTFEAPVNPGPWHPNKPVTRGEAAVFIGGYFDEIGKAFL